MPTTAEWALIISSASLIIAFLGLLWNVYSRFIHPKARVQCVFNVAHVDLVTNHMVISPNGTSFPTGWNKDVLQFPALRIAAINHGPGDVTLQIAIARKRRGLRRDPLSVGMLNPYNDYPTDLDSNGPYSGGLPKTLGIGEEFAAYFPVTKSWFADQELVKFGFNDSFGRAHYCQPSDVKKVRSAVLSGSIL